MSISLRHSGHFDSTTFRGRVLFICVDGSPLPTAELGGAPGAPRECPPTPPPGPLCAPPLALPARVWVIREAGA